MSDLLSRMTDVNDTKIQYELDETGMNPDNYIMNEIHTVSSTRYRDYNIIIPEFPPFYVKDIKVRYKKNANTAFVELHENADFSLGLFYKGATRVVGQPVYGCLLFNNLDLDGIIQIDYRTMGGDQLVDRRHVLETLINNVWNPREKGWEYVTNTPNVYPPVQHPLDWENIYRLDSLVKQLKEMGDTISENGKNTVQVLQEFLDSVDVRKLQLLIETMNGHSYTDLLNQVRALTNRQKELEARIGTLTDMLK